MSSRSFLGTVIFPEQVCLEPFLEGGETVSVSDGGGEFIPPLGGQTGEELVLGPGGLERWDHQTVVRGRLKVAGGGVGLEERLDVVGCSPIRRSEGQYQGLESDTGRDGQPVKGDEERGNMGASG